MAPLRPNPPRPWATLLLAALATAPLAGCSAFATLAGERSGLSPFTSREMVHEFEADLETTWEATQEALGRLDYERPDRKGLEAYKAWIVGDGYHVRLARYTGDGTRIRLRLDPAAGQAAGRREGVLLDEVARVLEQAVDFHVWSDQVRELADDETEPER